MGFSVAHPEEAEVDIRTFTFLIHLNLNSYDKIKILTADSGKRATKTWLELDAGH